MISIIFVTLLPTIILIPVIIDLKIKEYRYNKKTKGLNVKQWKDIPIELDLNDY